MRRCRGKLRHVSIDADAMDIEMVCDENPELHALVLNKCAALPLPGRCRNLVRLKLSDMQFSEHALDGWLEANRETLRDLNLMGCHLLQGTMLRSMASLTRLEHLNLNGCHDLDDATVIELVQLSSLKLKSFNVRYCHKLTDQSVVALVTHQPALRDVNLRYCYKLTDRALRALAALPLRKLNLSQCTRLTDTGMHEFVTHGRRTLHELRVWGCHRLSWASVDHISQHLTELTYLDIRTQDVLGQQNSVARRLLAHQTYRQTLLEWHQDGVYAVAAIKC